MAKLNESQISEIVERYAIIGTYSGVAKELHVSPATVKKYIVLSQESEKEKEPVKKEKVYIEIPSIESIVKPEDLSSWLLLSGQELKEMRALTK